MDTQKANERVGGAIESVRSGMAPGAPRKREARLLAALKGYALKSFGFLVVPWYSRRSLRPPPSRARPWLSSSPSPCCRRPSVAFWRAAYTTGAISDPSSLCTRCPA